MAERRIVELELSFRPPLDWQSLIAFLSARAIPEIETAARHAYHRTIDTGAGWGRLDAQPASSGEHLAVRLDLPVGKVSSSLVERLRDLFDLEADPAAIAACLRADPDLTGSVESSPGLRVPGGWDLFELTVRAILGQQVTVRGAATLGSRLVRAYGRRLPGGRQPEYLFPEPAALARAELSEVGLPAARAATIRDLAEAVELGRINLSPEEDPEALRRALVALRGIGDWTAQYVTLRGARDRDAFPVADLALLRAASTRGKELSPSELRRRAEAWRPWRGYAAMHLWRRYALRAGRGLGGSLRG